MAADYCVSFAPPSWCFGARNEGLSDLCARVATADRDFVFVDRLNRRAGIWPDTKTALESKCPAFLAEYLRVLFGGDILDDTGLRARVYRVAGKTGLLDRVEWCFLRAKHLGLFLRGFHTVR